ncbi:MAG: hypothetical protein O2955_18605 [Planctomycetota bacterium]|nr:hypothetical protein [Planctomycetota bacterium]MDA1214525.1 hypothetical protein [Planctomycetota bacterium]
MSTRWIVGICLGCGIALIASGIAQTILFAPQNGDLKASQSHIDPNVQPAIRESNDSVNEFLSSPPPNDHASPADLELADEFSRTLKSRRGVIVSRSAHNASAESR